MVSVNTRLLGQREQPRYIGSVAGDCERLDEMMAAGSSLRQLCPHFCKRFDRAECDRSKKQGIRPPGSHRFACRGQEQRGIASVAKPGQRLDGGHCEGITRMAHELHELLRREHALFGKERQK
jgi:hypothetical protein